MQRLDGYEVFEELLLPIVVSLQEIEKNPGSSWNPDTYREAGSLARKITNFDFLISFVATQNILAYVRGLTVRLQSRTLDSSLAYDDVSSVTQVLVNVRSNIKEKTAEIMVKAREIAELVDVSKDKIFNYYSFIWNMNYIIYSKNENPG